MQNSLTRLFLFLAFLLLWISPKLHSQTECGDILDLVQSETNDSFVFTWTVDGEYDLVTTTVTWIDNGILVETPFDTSIPNVAVEIPLDIYNKATSISFQTACASGGLGLKVFVDPSVDIAVIYSACRKGNLRQFDNFVFIKYLEYESAEELIAFANENPDWSEKRGPRPKQSNIGKSVERDCMCEFVNYTDEVIYDNAETLSIGDISFPDCDEFSEDGLCAQVPANSIAGTIDDIPMLFFMSHWLLPKGGDELSTLPHLYLDRETSSCEFTNENNYFSEERDNSDCSSATFSIGDITFEAKGLRISVLENTSGLETILKVGRIGREREEFQICNTFDGFECNGAFAEFLHPGEFYIAVQQVIDGEEFPVLKAFILDCTTTGCFTELFEVNRVKFETEGLELRVLLDTNVDSTIIDVGKIGSDEEIVRLCHESENLNCGEITHTVDSPGKYFVNVQTSDGQSEGPLESYDFYLQECIPGELIGSNLEIGIPEPELTIFPNPSNGQFNLAFDAQEEQATVTVFNTAGEIVYENYSLSGQVNRLDLSEQPQGLYIVQLKLQSGVQRSQLISKL